MLDFCSSFLNKQCYFGCYPNPAQFNELVENDIKYFIDLTTVRERDKLQFDYSFLIPNLEGLVYYNFSIVDNNIPHCPLLYDEFVQTLNRIISQKKERVYIHCRGGHGRSPMLVASILCCLFFYTPYEALTLTKNYYANRFNLKEKYKGIPCPQLYSQRKFIIDLYQIGRAHV